MLSLYQLAEIKINSSIWNKEIELYAEHEKFHLKAGSVEYFWWFWLLKATLFPETERIRPVLEKGKIRR